MKFEIEGKVEVIGNVQTFASGFTKRQMVLTDNMVSSYPQHIPFQFKKDKVALLDGVKVGQEVKVTFAVDGRQWNDPKTNMPRYFVDLTGLDIKVLGSVAVPKPAEPVVDEVTVDVEDIPF